MDEARNELRAYSAPERAGVSRFLGPDGKVLRPLPTFAENRAAVVRLYRAMVLTRTFDAKAIALQRTGRLGTYASALGQEAIGVGVASAMIADDVFAGTYREQAAQIVRGAQLQELFLFWGGDERGSNWSGGAAHDFPVCIPIGTQAPHSVGAALALRTKGIRAASVCVFGDGASSKGDIYEAMNMAGVWKLPVLFVLNNNGWAISVPREAQSAAERLCDKAIGCGFEGEQVDGNDVIAVHAAARTALERMRGGGGPHLIEALSYRLTDHTTADDATRYRSDEDVSRQWQSDPIKRLRTFLTKHHAWTRADEEELIASCRAEVNAAAEAYLSTPHEPPEAIFDHLYAELPKALESQRAAVMRKGAEKKGNGHD
jgi:2-oxoisovalerate dehydrogenase E1 component alpha subunit